MNEFNSIKRKSLIKNNHKDTYDMSDQPVYHVHHG